MEPTFSIASAAILALTVLLSATPAQPQDRHTDDSIVQQIDEILNRLQVIEARLAILEDQSKFANEWRVDERGVVRTLEGRPVGHWASHRSCPKALAVRVACELDDGPPIRMGPAERTTP